MREIEPETQESELNLDSIIFMLFRHKGMLLLCTAIGMVAAAIYFFIPHLYESKAKLMVRYVVDRSAIDRVDPQVKISNGENAINSEVEILTSWDLALQVADAIGVERLAPGAGKTGAANSIRLGLTATALKESNIILISYKNRDPEIARRVLEELVNRYFDKHLQVHRSLGAFNFVAQQTDLVRTRLNQTEEELKQLKEKAGITSDTETVATLGAALDKNQRELDDAEVEFAEQSARVNELEKSVAGANANQAHELSTQLINRDSLQQYQSLLGQVARVRQHGLDLLSKYTKENQLLKSNQAQIEALERQRDELERKFPGLSNTSLAVANSQNSQVELVSQKARLAAISAKMEKLRTQLHFFQAQAQGLADAGIRIAQLDRDKELEEANYKYFQASLERARVDEALDPTKIPNISVVQSPSAALKDTSKLAKTVLSLAGGGIGLGLALVFLVECVFDRTVKRPVELETRFGIPVWVSIPYFKDIKNGGISSFIRPFCEAIRDRLVLYFELNRPCHKTKFLAVAGLSDRAGTSSVAWGLAVALSENGGGKVLLVSMHPGSAEPHPVFKGGNTSLLSEALHQSSLISPVAENLFLAVAEPSNRGRGCMVPKKFYDMIPQMQSSRFDYIIFDMPPLEQTSATLAMAGFMDKFLLVVEAEENNIHVVKRVHEELVAAKANIAGVFNKSRDYVPRRVMANA